MKWKEEVSWSGVNVIFACVQEKERAREGAAALLNDVWHSAVVKSEFISYRILWIKFKFTRVKVCVVVGYGPNEWDGEDRTTAGITGAFGVPRYIDNGRRVVEFCEERGLWVSNTYFKHRSVHKYTRVTRCGD